MKTKNMIPFFFAFAIVFGSCKEDETKPQLLSQWKLISARNYYSMRINLPEIITITFKNDTLLKETSKPGIPISTTIVERTSWKYQLILDIQNEMGENTYFETAQNISNGSLTQDTNKFIIKNVPTDLVNPQMISYHSEYDFPVGKLINSPVYRYSSKEYNKPFKLDKDTLKLGYEYLDQSSYKSIECIFIKTN
jgi:hypothetical protein